MGRHTHNVARHAPGLLVLLALLCAFGAESGGAQTERAITVNVDNPRPLASALDAIERRYGWVITYEDPPYVHVSEIADITQTVRKDYDPTKPKVLVPRGGAFDFGYVDPSTASEPDPEALLQALLDDYHAKALPGIFRLVRAGSAFHVVPMKAKNARGELEERQSILDVSISMPDEPQNALERLRHIASAITKTAHTRVGVGTVPLNLLMQTQVQKRASNEIARDVLLRTLESTKRTLSWRLFCDPGLVRTCALNVHIVPDRSRPSQ